MEGREHLLEEKPGQEGPNEKQLEEKPGKERPKEERLEELQEVVGKNSEQEI